MPLPPFSHYYQRFVDRINGTTLKDYWGIKIKPDESLDILYSYLIYDPSSNGNFIHFSIEYSKTYSLDFIGLPKEMSNIINEYAKDTIEIRTMLFYNENYPFHHPIWEITFIQHNTHIQIEKITKKIVDLINCNHQNNWSPVVRIDSQLFGFFIDFYRDVITNPVKKYNSQIL